VYVYRNEKELGNKEKSGGTLLNDMWSMRRSARYRFCQTLRVSTTTSEIVFERSGDGRKRKRENNLRCALLGTLLISLKLHPAIGTTTTYPSPPSPVYSSIV
jgi:hypothetical protein